MTNKLALTTTRSGAPAVSTVHAITAAAHRLYHAGLKIEYLMDDARIYREPGAAWRQVKLPDLPADIDVTLPAVLNAMTRAQPRHIAGMLLTLSGLFPAGQPDAQVLSTFGVDMIEAEGVSTLALGSALIEFLRPVEADDDDDQPPPQRRFMPTMPEIIAALRYWNDHWRHVRACIADLPERHALALRMQRETPGNA